MASLGFALKFEKAGYDVLGESESRAAAESISLLSQQQEQGELLTRLQGAIVFSVPLMLAHWLNLSSYTVDIQGRRALR